MKDDKIYLEYILECIERIDEYTELDRNNFLTSTFVQDAVLRNLQTLAETTQKISEELKSQHVCIQWRAIVGFRNVLVHDYLGIDLDKIWLVIENRLPELKKNIINILNKIS